MSDTILITGAGRGIGLALTQALLNRGQRVIATCRRPDPADALHQLLSQPGMEDRLSVQPLDITSDESVSSLARFVEQQGSTLDVLVNNGAIFIDRLNTSLSNLDLDHLVTTFQTNVVGVARITQALLPFLARARRPRIVNISTGAGLISTKRNSKYYAYSISKAGLNMLTRMLEMEARERSICVVAVTPGRVKTEMGDSDAPLTPQECAESLAGMIEKLQLSDAGRFLDRDGRPCFDGEFKDATGRVCSVGW
jgi:NAD(P)-dependent dehydrogenase (short-subunit alcohol dehydrogenase family)